MIEIGLHHETVLKPGRDEDRDGKVLYYSSSQSDTEIDGKVQGRPKRNAGRPPRFGDNQVKKPKLVTRSRVCPTVNDRADEADESDIDDEENEESLVTGGKKTYTN